MWVIIATRLTVAQALVKYTFSASGLRKGVELRLGVSGKLILAMIAVSVVSTVAMGLAIRIGFDKGFVDYLNVRGVNRLETLLPRVAAEFKRHGDWQFIIDSPGRWFDLVGLPGMRSEAPPIGTPVPVSSEVASIDSSGVSLRIALLDGRRNFVIGYLSDRDASIEREILVDGNVVGWLVYVPATEVISEADQSFKKRQDQASLLIGMASLIIAAGLAVILSNRFIRVLVPIRDAIGKLARGYYVSNLAIDSNDELGDLSADVNHLARVLAKNEAVRRELMGDLSHELRTPIAVLQAELEAIHDGVREPTPESIRSLLTEVKTLGILVRDIYEVSTSDAGALTYQFHPVDIADILDCTIHAFEERRSSCSLSLDYPGYTTPVFVEGDDGRLNQLFNNLIENSVRYTCAGGTIRVRVSEISDKALLVVEDSAPSVDDLEIASIFDRAFRGRQREDTDKRGNGLGLAICKNIVEAHRGEITASQSALGGLRIEISVPLMAK